jgi:hypothetical protein
VTIFACAVRIGLLKVFKADAVVRADTETYNSSSTPLGKKNTQNIDVNMTWLLQGQ